jgi:hypothetical protein
MPPPKKFFTVLTVWALSLVALLHIIRFVLRWQVIVEGVEIPLWASLLGAIVTATMAAMLLRESRRP